MISCYFIGYSKRFRGYKFYDLMNKSNFETKNAWFFENVEFRGEDTFRNHVFEENYVNILTSVIDLVQDPIPDIDHDTTNQDNVKEQIFFFQKSHRRD